MSSLPDLIYRIAHDYPGAVPALAVRMGKNVRVLQNKLNPNFEPNAINAHEIEQMVDLANANDRMARHFADKAGLLCIPMVMYDGSDTTLLDGFMESVKELGELSTEFQKSYADGNINQKELQRIKSRTTDVMVALAGFVNRVEQIAE